MLLFVRHGQSEANLSGLLVGRLDSPLTDLGARQAEAIAAALARRATRTGAAPVRILSSPLARALATARAIEAALVAGAPRGSAPVGVEVAASFVEMDYGELDGTAPGSHDASLWSTWRRDPSFRPPGGETLEEVQARVAGACESLAVEAGRADVVVVSHVSPIKAAVAWALGAGPELAWRLSLGVASLTTVATTSGRPALVGFNERGHLGDLEVG